MPTRRSCKKGSNLEAKIETHTCSSANESMRQDFFLEPGRTWLFPCNFLARAVFPSVSCEIEMPCLFLFVFSLEISLKNPFTYRIIVDIVLHLLFFINFTLKISNLFPTKFVDKNPFNTHMEYLKVCQD